MAKDGIAFSAIIVTDGSFEVCRRSIEHFGKQTIRDEVELIVVGPSIEEMKPDYALLETFGAYQVVELGGPLICTGQGLASGFRAARGQILAYLEEHGYVPADFAEKLLQTFDETGSDVVAYTVIPENPGTVAWAHLFIQFGGAVPNVKTGPVKRPAGHHTAYRKSVLVPFNEELDDLLSNEAVLFETFRQRGVPMHLTNEITVEHAQISRLSVLVTHEFASSVTYAETRWKTQNWPIWKRAVYTLGAPLIPFWRTGRALSDIRRSGRGPDLSILVLPVMFLGTIAGALGEVVGYVFGGGQRLVDRRTAVELDRYSYTTEEDRERMQKKTAA